MDLSAPDLESALLMLQSQRAQLLGEALRQQMDSVADCNAQVAGLNGAMAGKLAENQALSDANAQMQGQIEKMAANPGGGQGADIPALQAKMDANSKMIDANTQALAEMKSDLNALASQLKDETQRLESMTAKRDGVADMLADLLQKMQDSRSKILANMR
ncbi:hypothetical protein [Achromobacter sp. Bel]|uniref:hypothetical protein n=1 Tax=Achromobacter sp. Bel TaxID=2727415 RepID=UPI00145DA5BC|nr:hypothetical protein [Achromobacter sp. Bel]NMK47576.1 hypothetical protein [Achromobacter sp. Bel]